MCLFEVPKNKVNERKINNEELMNFQCESTSD